MPRSKRSYAAALMSWGAPICSLVMVAALPRTGLAAETLPASVRACRAEPDSLKRLICFDKETARYDAAAAGSDAPHESVPSPGSSAPAPSSIPAPVSQSPSSAARVGSAAVSAPASVPDQDASADEPKPPPKPKHFQANIVGIEDKADEVVVHLDNGQVWEQEQPATADLNLQRGETVTIDRELGSYWLSGRNGAVMKVHLKKRK
jgi:hypothetical protein